MDGGKETVMLEAIIGIAGVVLGVGGKFAYDTQQKANGKQKIARDLAQAERKASEIILRQRMRRLRPKRSEGVSGRRRRIVSLIENHP